MIDEREREIWIGENRVLLSEDDILYWQIVGEIDEGTVISLNEAANTLLNQLKGKVNVIVDLNNAGKPSHNARKLGVKYLESGKYSKVAYFGANPVTRVLGSFFMGLSKKTDMRFFKSKEEALAWVRE